MLECAFHVLPDYNEDDALCPMDLNKMLEALTGSKMSKESRDKIIDHVGTMSCIAIELHCNTCQCCMHCADNVRAGCE